MRFVKSGVLLLTLTVLALLVVGQASATTVLQMNLEDLCDSSAQIFRGTIVDISETTISVGGGEVPAIVYTAEVTEGFKGEFTTVKGVQLAEFKVVGTLKQHAAGQAPIAGFPLLQIGGDYLLMIAQAGPVGLTAPMGLGQGSFSVDGKAGAETAVNGFNNEGLWKGMSVSGVPASGPVDYATLANMIRAGVEE